MRVIGETKVMDGRKDERTDGRTEGRTDGKDGTYSAGVKDSASAYVLCPRLTEQLCLSIWKGTGSAERDLGTCGSGPLRCMAVTSLIFFTIFLF